MNSFATNQSETFYIFTTGIADWCNLEKTFAYWNDHLCLHICSLIHYRFKYIEIVHSDIFDDFNGVMSITNDIKNNTMNEINRRLQFENVHKRNIRIVSSRFQQTPLDLDEIATLTNHIIIDFAHVINNNNLNVVYLGYVGEKQIVESYMCTRYINNFFRVNDDNTITTYIDQLSNQNRFSPLIQDYPSDNIKKIMEQIRRRLGFDFKQKYGNYSYFDSIFNEENVDIHQRIVDIIMYNIMNTDNNEETIITNIIQHLKTLY